MAKTIRKNSTIQQKVNNIRNKLKDLLFKGLFKKKTPLKNARYYRRMNGFEIYKVYLAIKLHFTSKNRSYDFHRHGGRTTAKLETFTKRRDRYFFHKLSRTYNSTTVVDYFVSNFVNNTNLWVGDIIGSTGDESYKEWSKRIESLHYYYEQDIDYILERMTANEIEFDDIFTSHDGQHPPILKMVLSKKICVETFVILEDILSFANRLDKDILETVLWPKMHDRMARYKPNFKHTIHRDIKLHIRKKVKVFNVLKNVEMRGQIKFPLSIMTMGELTTYKYKWDYICVNVENDLLVRSTREESI